MKQENSLTEKWYIKKVIELLKNSPSENKFQDFIVYPILESVINSKENNELEVIDCHDFRRYNTKTHDRCQYSVLAKAVPDLIIAKNFFYDNRSNDENNNKIEVATAIEVKEPNNKWMLNKSVKLDNTEYNINLYLELLPNLFKNKKLILTNIRRWEFFDVSKIKDEELNKSIELYVNILELCGFDAYKDYKYENGRKKLNSEVIKAKLGKLKDLGDSELKKKIEEFEEMIKKEHFDELIEFADKCYESKIKKYVQNAHIESIDLITSKEILNYSDLKKSIPDLDSKNWNKLFEKISQLISISH
nr:hypothetical protein [Mediterraneibacter faecis]